MAHVHPGERGAHEGGKRRVRYTPAPVALHLVRHASAGRRGTFDGDDLARPLDDEGRRQREAIRAYFAAAPVRAVWSSVAVRCVETVDDLARVHGLEVVTRAELTEGARSGALLDLLLEEAPHEGDLVMCSHGDLIPEVLNCLLRTGLRVSGPRGCAKGSIWTLSTDGNGIRTGTYIADPSVL